jgi:hypothetical protein
MYRRVAAMISASKMSEMILLDSQPVLRQARRPD